MPPCTARASEDASANWKELYLAQHQGLLKAACRYVDRHQAEDIVQDAFLRLWDRSPLWLHTDYAPAKLLVSVRRLCLTFLRRARHSVVTDPECLDSMSADPKAKQKPSAKELAPLLRLLPPLQAQALRWRSDGMSLSEIALRQGVRLGTVKWRLWAARSRLQRLLAK